MKYETIVWDEQLGRNAMWMISVDVTHVWEKEYQHPEWSQDPTYYSQKHNKADMDFELGISLNTNQFVWMNGAVCVVCQYRIEHEHPLFDILIEDIVDRL